MSRRLLAAALVATGLAAPASAEAALVGVQDSTLVLRAAPETTTNVLAEQTDPDTVRLTRVTSGERPDDDEVALPPGAGCRVDETTAQDDVVCDGVERVDAQLGDRDDALSARTAGPPMPRGLMTIPLTAVGDTGDDAITGGAGADTLLGEAGADVLDGADGADVLDGAGGGDELTGGGGADALAGGDDFDSVSYAGAGDATPITVTLDGRANDGAPGEEDDVRPDVEDVVGSEGPDAVTGDAGPNVLTGLAGDDTLDGAAGEDELDAGAGDDAVLAGDGFADRVACGPGDDRAVLDALDVVSDDCEAVDRAAAAAARDVPEDRPPGVAFLLPAPDVHLIPGPATLVATAGDDQGVARVEFLDDGRVVATDETAPYTAVYRPGTDDVGRNTLAVRAVDTSGQTATDLRPVRVERFVSGALSARVTPTVDRRAPFRFLITGRLSRTAAVSFDETCRGWVTVQIKAGSRTLSSRRARVRRDCSFISNVTFRTRGRFAGRRSLRITTRFAGNAVLLPGSPVMRTVRVPRAPKRRS